MDAKTEPVVLRVKHLVVAERHVPDGKVVEAGPVGRLEARDGNLSFRIELPGNAPGDAVQLHAVKLTVRHALRQQTEEVTYAHGRLQNAPALEAHVAKCVVDCADDRGRGVVRVECGAARGLVFFGRQRGFELFKLSPPFRFAIIERFWYSAPAGVT